MKIVHFGNVQRDARLAACCLCLALGAACSTPPPAPPVPSATLFARLGGMDRIAAIVSQTVDAASSDARTKASFNGINLQRLKASVASHLCQVVDGPCRYTGQDMAQAHAGLAITPAQFAIMDAYLGQALAAHQVDPGAIAEVRVRLGAMQADVTGK
ncbi:MAG: group 1 truncated hemoglobin [Pseudomonadota bacterium]